LRKREKLQTYNITYNVGLESGEEEEEAVGGETTLTDVVNLCPQYPL